MTTQTTVHRAHKIRIQQHYPDNANGILIKITHGDHDEAFELQIYDLPERYTELLMAAFADRHTRVIEGG